MTNRNYFILKLENIFLRILSKSVRPIIAKVNLNDLVAESIEQMMCETINYYLLEKEVMNI